MYETKEERDTLFSLTGKFSELRVLNEKATGFGWAVLVQDNFEGGRTKVVKLPNRDEATRELRIEADILSKLAQYLRHPNLIELGSVERYTIHWHGKKEERWFIVLQYGGDSLRSRMGRLGVRNVRGKDEYVYHNGKALNVDEVLEIAIQVTDGLRALHDFEEVPGQHIVHRDIKPENILIDEHGTVRLTDFGISKVVERVTQSLTVAGTPPYLAPEYSRGRITAASDIYSLGIVLYELATGQFPFRYPDERFYELPTPPHVVNSGIPCELSDVIVKALHWNPTATRREEVERYQRAADMLVDLRRCYRRLHPVPPQYERVSDGGASSILYRDVNSEDEVRIFLYETERAAQCVSRLATAVHLTAPQILSPRETFENEDIIGVVVAQPSAPTLQHEDALDETIEQLSAGPSESAKESSTASATVTYDRSEFRCLPTGREVYDFVANVLVLCEQLQEIHQLGVIHGALTPHNVTWDGKYWLIDHIWLGALMGLTDAEKVLRQTGVSAGYLAPEVLRWETPPPLSSDIYGLGAVMYGTLTGTPPMDPASALATTRGEPPPPFRAGSAIRGLAPTLSRKLRDILVKALQPDPISRHRSIEEIAEALRQCCWPEDMVATFIEDALEHQKRGEIVEAYDTLDEALRLDPGNPLVHHTRAEIYFLESEFEWALRENAKALDIERTAPAHYLHGQALAAKEKFAEAAEEFRMGLELDDCSRGRRLLARCLEQDGQHNEAVFEYEQAVKIAELVEQDNVRVQEIKSDLSALLSRLKD